MKILRIAILIGVIVLAQVVLEGAEPQAAQRLYFKEGTVTRIHGAAETNFVAGSNYYAGLLFGGRALPGGSTNYYFADRHVTPEAWQRLQGAIPVFSYAAEISEPTIETIFAPYDLRLSSPPTLEPRRVVESHAGDKFEYSPLFELPPEPPAVSEWKGIVVEPPDVAIPLIDKLASELATSYRKVRTLEGMHQPTEWTPKEVTEGCSRLYREYLDTFARRDFGDLVVSLDRQFSEISSGTYNGPLAPSPLSSTDQAAIQDDIKRMIRNVLIPQRRAYLYYTKQAELADRYYRNTLNERSAALLYWCCAVADGTEQNQIEDDFFRPRITGNGPRGLATDTKTIRLSPSFSGGPNGESVGRWTSLDSHDTSDWKNFALYGLGGNQTELVYANVQMALDLHASDLDRRFFRSEGARLVAKPPLARIEELEKIKDHVQTNLEVVLASKKLPPSECVELWRDGLHSQNSFERLDFISIVETRLHTSLDERPSFASILIPAANPTRISSTYSEANANATLAQKQSRLRDEAARAEDGFWRTYAAIWTNFIRTIDTEIRRARFEGEVEQLRSAADDASATTARGREALFPRGVFRIRRWRTNSAEQKRGDAVADVDFPLEPILRFELAQDDPLAMVASSGLAVKVKLFGENSLPLYSNGLPDQGPFAGDPVPEAAIDDLREVKRSQFEIAEKALLAQLEFEGTIMSIQREVHSKAIVSVAIRLEPRHYLVPLPPGGTLNNLPIETKAEGIRYLQLFSGPLRSGQRWQAMILPADIQTRRTVQKILLARIASPDLAP